MTTTPPPLSSILYPLSSPRLADARTHPSIHPSSPLRAVNQHSDGWRVQPTIYLHRPFTHTQPHIYRREYVCEYEYDRVLRARDGRANACSVAPPGLRASPGRPSHRHTDARRRRRRDVFHHGSRDVPPHDDDDDDDTSTTGDDRARRRCESR